MDSASKETCVKLPGFRFTGFLFRFISMCFLEI